MQISCEKGKDNNAHYPTNRTKHESRQYIALLILNVQIQFLHVSEPLSEIYKYIYIRIYWLNKCYPSRIFVQSLKSISMKLLIFIFYIATFPAFVIF